LIIITVSSLAGCGAQAITTPFGIAAPAITFHPDNTSTLTLSPTTVSIPTMVPTDTTLPSIQASYYRLRIEYTTTSDWSTLVFSDTSNILTLRQMETVGNPAGAGVSAEQLSLNQPLDETGPMPEVGMEIDYALSPQAISQPLSLTLRKGNVGKSTVTIYAVSGGQKQILKEINHTGIIPDSNGENPLAIELELDPLTKQEPIQAQIERRTEKMVWAFYYPWYLLADWSSPMLRDHPQTRYASNDPQAISRQIDQAQGAGIDGFISSWWGPGDYTDSNLALLLSIAEEKGFSVSIYFETLLNNHPRTADQILSWLRYAIKTYGNHTAFFKVNGKPVIVIWASGSVPLETWQNIFSQLRGEGLEAVYLAMGYDLANLDVFDGIHLYGVINMPNLAEVTRSTGKATHYYSLLSSSGETKIWVATAQPGYDDQLIPSREGLVQDRLDGQYYRDTFATAISSDPDWIFITTWNEWWEHTYIEPSEEYGEQYLDLTRQLTSEWKGK